MSAESPAEYFAVSLPPALRKKAEASSRAQGVSLESFVLAAVEESLARTRSLHSPGEHEPTPEQDPDPPA